MYENFTHSNLDRAFVRLGYHLIKHGDDVGSRNGRVLEQTHVGVTLLHPWEREITLEGRKANIAAQIAETMWVLSGRDDMDFLTQYLPRAIDYSDDGKVWRGAYGPRLRNWREWWPDPMDQWAHVIDLLRANPLDRRAVIAIYDPTTDTAPGKDIPCNNWITFSSRKGHLDMHVALRSNDLMWGFSGINAFEWSTMLEITAAFLGLKMGSLHFSTTSLHLYEPHWRKVNDIVTANQATVKPDMKESPRFKFQGSGAGTPSDFDELADEWFTLEWRIRRDGAAYVQEQVDNFPEPMLQSWLRVLQWWWSGDKKWLKPLEGTRLGYAVSVALQPKREVEAPLSPFMEHAISLHTEKEAAYGGSWKRRGEMLGIMANIARKIDRLMGGETQDETSADTALDLMVYLAKYRVWLSENLEDGVLGSSDGPNDTNALLRQVESRSGFTGSLEYDTKTIAERLVKQFDRLEEMVAQKMDDRRAWVSGMLSEAYVLARVLFGVENEQQMEDEYRGADAD